MAFEVIVIRELPSIRFIVSNSEAIAFFFLRTSIRATSIRSTYAKKTDHTHCIELPRVVTFYLCQWQLLSNFSYFFFDACLALSSYFHPRRTPSSWLPNIFEHITITNQKKQRNNKDHLKKICQKNKWKRCRRKHHKRSFINAILTLTTRQIKTFRRNKPKCLQ